MEDTRGKGQGGRGCGWGASLSDCAFEMARKWDRNGITRRERWENDMYIWKLCSLPSRKKAGVEIGAVARKATPVASSPEKLLLLNRTLTPACAGSACLRPFWS